MRKLILEVPEEAIGDFTEKLIELGLENSITGRTEDEEIEIEINYEKDESERVDALESFLEKIKEDLYEDEDD